MNRRWHPVRPLSIALLLSLRKSVEGVDETANRPPEAVGVIPALTLTAGGAAVSASVARYFRDPDGDRLIYQAESNDAATVVGTRMEN